MRGPGRGALLVAADSAHRKQSGRPRDDEVDLRRVAGPDTIVDWHDRPGIACRREVCGPHVVELVAAGGGGPAPPDESRCTAHETVDPGVTRHHGRPGGEYEPSPGHRCPRQRVRLRDGVNEAGAGCCGRRRRSTERRASGDSHTRDHDRDDSDQRHGGGAPAHLPSRTRTRFGRPAVGRATGREYDARPRAASFH